MIILSKDGSSSMDLLALYLRVNPISQEMWI